MSYTGFFLDTPYKVVDGNIVYAQDLNNPLAAISTGIASLVDAVQTGADIASGVDVGTVNAYQISLVAAPASYVDGLMVWFKPGATNTGASTLNVNSLGAKAIRSSVRSALVGGELLSGFWFQLKYSSTHNMFLIVSYPGGTDISATRTLVAGDGIGVTSNDTTVWVEVADNGVTTEKIADGAVTTAKIAVGAVTQDKISNAPDMVHNDIIGGDASVSGNTITFTACSCWDSTREYFLETLVDKTWTVPATNNLEVYLFLVRLNDETIAVKGYSTYAAAASDVGVNITHWRFISWNKNNGSGVTMPYKQVGDEMAWLSGEMPIITSTLTTSMSSYDVTVAVPSSLFTRLGIVATVLGCQHYVGYTASDNILGYDSPCGLGVVEIKSVTSIYMKYNNLSGPVKVRHATLRR